jgi:hypothetical protein
MRIERRLAVEALAAGVAVAATVAAAAVGLLGRSSPPQPCLWSPTLAEAKRSMFVFEGIVADRWDETVLDNTWQVRRLRTYRFHVLRNWSSTSGGSGRGPEFIHGLQEGERYMQGTYRTFERGQRYLIAANTVDSPPHTYTTSCFPGAEGDAIAAMAAELGPPLATFEPRPLPAAPFWLPLARGAQDAARFTVQLGHAAAHVIRHGF